MKIGPLDLYELDRNYLCLVRLKHIDAPGVIRQVTLRSDKVHDGFIRLGETPNDEANGWQYPENVEVLSIIGIAEQDKEGKWGCRPFLEIVKDALEPSSA